METECELLVEGGTVIDGTGSAPIRADVAVTDDRIVAVGPLGDMRASTRLDATGRVVSPGFIDVHTHDDIDAVDRPDMTAKLSQGVTTVVAGNCGISAAPLDPVGPLPPPFPLLGDDSAYRYPTVAAYRDALEAAAPAVNLALLVGHSSLRISAMGDLSRSAETAEVDAMRSSLEKALDSGCIGLSSGLEYPPAVAADVDELVAVLAPVRDAAGAVYATHMRNEGDHIDDALNEAIETADRAGVPLVVSHHKCAGSANHGRSVQTLAQIDRARAETRHGVHLDVYPYTAGSTSLLPDFAERAESTLVAWSTPRPEAAGRILDELAAEWGCSRNEAIEQLTPAGAIYFLMDDADVERIMAHPAAMIGSDGLPGRTRPHPRLWGTFPRVLGRYVRDRSTLDLPTAVHKMTGLPASVFPLGRRGVIAEGAVADLVVFDSTTISDAATYDEPEQPADGIDAVVVGGAVAWTNEGHTGVRSGRFIAR